MKAIFTWPAALLLVVFFSSSCFAQVVWYFPALDRPLGQAPDARGPGLLAVNRYGGTFGPNYYLRPPFPPESGVGPGRYQQQKQQKYQPYQQYQQQPRYVIRYQYQYRPVKIHPHRPPVMMRVPVPVRVPIRVATRPRGLPPIHTLPHLPHLKPKIPPKPSFPSHPFARSPRDFFMWGAAAEDQVSRLRHPLLIP